MANPMKGEAIARVEAGEFTLAYTLGACRAFQGEAGMQINKALASLNEDNPDLDLYLILIWAGLKKHHQMTVDEVGDLVTMAEAEVWGEAISRCFPADEEAPGSARPQKAKPQHR